MKCFRCHEYRHVIVWYPTRILLIEDAGLDEGNLEDIYKSKGGISDTNENVRVSSIQVGVIRYSHIAIRDKGWRSSNVFHIYNTYKGKIIS